MRIIGGEHRSRSILSPPEKGPTRPITDRVKETLFNRLMARGLTGEGCVLDIFAGTGSMGLEALSRGAEHCTFIERDKRVRSLLEQNIAALGYRDRTAVMSVDALAGSWLALLPRRPIALSFCDPPYALMAEETTRLRVLNLVAQLHEVTEPGGLLVLRSPEQTPIPEVSPWAPPRVKRYGTMLVGFFEKPGEPADEAADVGG